MVRLKKNVVSQPAHPKSSPTPQPSNARSKDNASPPQSSSSTETSVTKSGSDEKLAETKAPKLDSKKAVDTDKEEEDAEEDEDDTTATKNTEDYKYSAKAFEAVMNAKTTAELVKALDCANVPKAKTADRSRKSKPSQPSADTSPTQPDDSTNDPTTSHKNVPSNIIAKAPSGDPSDSSSDSEISSAASVTKSSATKSSSSRRCYKRHPTPSSSYEKDVKPLDKEYRFDRMARTFWTWLTCISNHAEHQNWQRLCTFYTPNGDAINLFDQYGDVTEEMIEKAAEDRQTDKLLRQKSKRMRIFLFHSVSTSVIARLRVFLPKVHKTDGPGLFKLIVNHFVPQCTAAIQATQAKLDRYTLADFNGNVVNYNHAASELYTQLRAAGMSNISDDTKFLTRLFTVYCQSEFEDICRDAAWLQKLHTSGNPEQAKMKAITFESVITYMNTQFQGLVIDGIIKTKKPSASPPIPTQTLEDQVLALQAQLHEFKEAHKQLTSQLNNKRKRESNTSAYNASDNKNNKKHWTRIPPAQGKSETMIRKDQTGVDITFKWCGNHGYWNKSHTTAECRMKSRHANNSAPGTNGNSSSHNNHTAIANVATVEESTEKHHTVIDETTTQAASFFGAGTFA